MRKMIITQDTFVMDSEPASGWSIEVARQAIEQITSEQELADLFAVIDNQAWWIEDEEYDFEEGTEEHKRARENTDAWFSLSDILRYRIFDILTAEGVKIPEKGYIVGLEPFMKRNGYRNGQGWWIKETD